MTRRRRMTTTLIAGSLTLLALAGVIILVTVLPESKPEDPSPSPTETKTEVADLIREAADGVASVLYTPPEGGPYSIRRDAGSGDLTLDAPGLLFPGKESSLRLAFNYAVSLPNLKVIAEDADDGQMALFGLDKPAGRWEVTRADGTAVELLLGAESATGSGRYACKRGGRTIVLLGELQTAYLTKTAQELYDLSFLPFDPPSEDNPTWQFITHYLLEKGDDAIELFRREDEEFVEGSFETSRFYLTRPYRDEGNDYMIETTILVPAAGIKPSEIVETGPADLAVYGLDNPARLTLDDSEGWGGTLLIGNFDSGRGGRYVMIKGIDCVLLDPDGAYPFLNADFSYLRSVQVWLYDIVTVASVTFEMEGVTRLLTFEHYTDDEETARLRGFLDGQEMGGVKETGETNARRLYMAALKIMQDGGVEVEIPAGEPAYRLTMAFLDGRSDVLELYALNERQYLIVLNGENTRLYIHQSSLRKNLLDKFDLIDAGKDIPRLA